MKINGTDDDDASAFKHQNGIHLKITKWKKQKMPFNFTWESRHRKECGMWRLL